MLRSIVAVLVGYAAMAIATIVGILLLSVAFGLPLDPEASKTSPPTAYVLANLVVSFGCAFLGGWTATRMATRSPQTHALVLAALVFVLGILYAIAGRGGPQPLWYLAALPVVGFLGIASAAMLRK